MVSQSVLSHSLLYIRKRYQAYHCWLYNLFHSYLEIEINYSGQLNLFANLLCPHFLLILFFISSYFHFYISLCLCGLYEQHKKGKQAHQQ